MDLSSLGSALHENLGFLIEKALFFQIISELYVQSVAKVLGHSGLEVGFLTEFEKLPPPPQNNVANSEHTFPCLFHH